MNSDNDLRNVDLNLLRVFGVLYRTRSTTRAAQALHLTQPSVSNALKRLRALFGDVLFVKTANGMQPTPRADAVANLIDEGFSSLRLALQAGSSFDPATSSRAFRLYVSDIGQSVFVPPLVARLRKAAPGIRIVTADPPLDTAQQMMKLGQIDLAIGLFRGLHTDFLQQRLFHETYAVLARHDHPGIGAKISLKQFFAADHVIYAPTAGSHARFEAELNTLALKHGKSRRVALELAHSFGLDRIVASSDLIACIPGSLARALVVRGAARGEVRALKLPFEMAPLDISQFWHERYQRDDGHHWLRGIVRELFHSDRPSTVP
ncbi:MAG: LysR family transcriptional regulator [Rhizomicrobium sp.]